MLRPAVVMPAPAKALEIHQPAESDKLRSCFEASDNSGGLFLGLYIGAYETDGQPRTAL